MPWCDTCDRFLSPNTVNDDGTCPECGTALATPRALERARAGRGSSADARVAREEGLAPQTDDAETPETTPWHFKVLLVALILYLTWRLVQGIIWVVHRL